MEAKGSSKIADKVKNLYRSPKIINVLYIPVLLIISGFIFYPFLRGVFISFTNWDGYSQTYDYVGLERYKFIFTDRNILLTIKNTFIYGIGSSIFQSIFGLAFAMLLDSKIKFKGISRTIIYLPVIISPLIMGYVWQFIFQYNHGALNDLVALFGVEKQTWLGNIDSAVYIVTLVNIFQFTGTTMIIYLAGLQTIPKQLKEAAGLDARNELQIFRYVTLPLLMPSITVTSVLNIIGGLKLFDIIVSLTKGGPGYATQSLSTMMYSLYFSRTDAGGAAALGVFMFVLIGIIGVATLKFFRSKEVEL